MRPFKGFRNLITLTMFGAALYAVFPPNIWGSIPEHTVTAHWIIYIPYTGVTIVLVSAVLFPHYFFHKLFSMIKSSRLDDFRGEIIQIQLKTHKNISKRILLLLEKGEVEKLKTWLIDVKILGEILVVALMHVILVEALTTLIQG